MFELDPSVSQIVHPTCSIVNLLVEEVSKHEKRMTWVVVQSNSYQYKYQTFIFYISSHRYQHLINITAINHQPTSSTWGCHYNNHHLYLQSANSLNCANSTINFFYTLLVQVQRASRLWQWTLTQWHLNLKKYYFDTNISMQPTDTHISRLQNASCVQFGIFRIDSVSRLVQRSRINCKTLEVQLLHIGSFYRVRSSYFGPLNLGQIWHIVATRDISNRNDS